MRRVLLAATDGYRYPIALLSITQPGVFDNRTAAVRWRRLDRAAKSRLRAEGLRINLIARIAHRQARGADQLHLVVRAACGWDRLCVSVYVAALKELGPRYGFGFVDDPYKMRHPKGKDGRPNRALPKRNMVFENPAIASRYLCGSYLVDSAQLRRMIAEGGGSFRALWVNPHLTRRSGITMRRLRRVRHGYWVKRAIDQGSVPRFPKWWGDLHERIAVLALLSPRIAASP